MQIDDRPHLESVWLIDGPGPEAAWPPHLDGKYAERRGEWYFPQGTSSHAILVAAGLHSIDTPYANGGNGSASVASAATAEDVDGDELLERPAAEFAWQPSTPREHAVDNAVKAWVDQLIDRTARNNLLYFRDQRAGTLDLTQAPPRPLFDVLAGRNRALSQLVAPDGIDDAARRAKTMYKKAQAFLEERGIHTLHVAFGLATWDNQHGTATPAAPILLAPMTLTPRGAAQQEFDLIATGELEVNPTLINALAVEFNCVCDPDELLSHAGIEGAIDTAEELEVAYSWLRDKARKVPGFAVRPKAVLGNFSYAKLPMVRDLQRSVQVLAEHDLIAALSGDGDGQRAVRDRRVDVDPSLPDQTPPADEFLVLDADSSQNYAINKVLAGQDLVIKGPPGTGKSQTISNLIACLTARGKSVLFVAEKRAAIDAVLKRLEAAGLDDLVLDLHAGVASKRLIAQSLAEALHTNANIPLSDVEADHRLLEARRRELRHWDEALHTRREPWGVSLFEAQQRLVALGSTASTALRLRGNALRSLDVRSQDTAREMLRDYVGHGGVKADASAWGGAPITSAEQVEQARDLVDELATSSIDRALDPLMAASAKVGLALCEHVSGWQRRLDLWDSIARTSEQFEAGIFSTPVDNLVEELAPMRRGLWERMNASMNDAEYRQAKKRAKGLQREGVRLRGPELLDALEGIADQQRQWNAQRIGTSAPEAPADLEMLHEPYKRLCEHLDKLAELLGIEEVDGGRQEVTDRVFALRNDAGTLGRLPQLHDLRTGLQAMGLGALLDDLARAHADVDHAIRTFEFLIAASVVDEIKLRDPAAGGFDGAQQRRTVSDFQQFDRRHISTSALRVRRRAAEAAVLAEDQAPEQATLIRREAAKRARHRPVRETFAKAPEVMTAIKPCWVMSPLVVSQLLPNEQLFDVVIFDEASQVRPAEAIPAIARGKRLVVAGDEKQLPPTDFFSGPTLGIKDDEDDTLSAAVGDFESVLDALLFLLDFRTLGWHYRSQDERLIAFSNAHLYDKSMLTFPGVSGPECLRHVEVPFQPGQAQGEDSSNAEVLKVVELILEHAEQRPEQTLGVIAMGITHADRVDASLRQALRDRPDLEEFFDENRPERFFIKNLERVQGDERDAIILTVGYGKNHDGQMVYRFGPLNSEGGERRLNVAVTRARKRMTVVSSFRSADMDPERTKARGADLLRRYIAYAESAGQVLDREVMDTTPLNPFEIDVRDHLQRAGIPLICQYGVSGYRLDFVAKHPDQPGRFVLAIEADGASYHSAQTTRDRDRLRQEQLERLGWRFHRIWSQDWFDDKGEEVRKARAAYLAAVDAADRPDAPTINPSGPMPDPVHPEEIAARSRGARPDIPATGYIDSYTDTQLLVMGMWVQNDTLLRTRDDHVAEVMRELGFTRKGSKIVGRIGAAVDRARATALASAGTAG